jgi:hypothetical protein
MRTELVPPRQALDLTIRTTTPLLLAGAVGAWFGGALAVAGIVLGVATAALSAVCVVPASTRAVLAALTVAAAAAGLAAHGDPALAAVCVGVAGLAQAPLNTRVAGAGVMLPVLVAIFATTELAVPAVPLGWWLLVGFTAMTVVCRVSGIALPTPHVPADVAWRHSVAMAVAGATAVYTTITLQIDHGHWLVLTLAFVLRPVPGETRKAARDRTLGTVGGAFVAVALVLLLPTPALVLAAVIGAVLLVGWAVAGDLRKQNYFGSAVVVLASSSGLITGAVDAATDRLVLTFVGALLAVGLADTLQLLDRRKKFLTRDPGE